MKKIGKLTVTSFISVALLLPSTGAQAAAPGSVRDLIGARAAGGESTLEERGFTMIHGSTRDGGKVNYWWNPNTKECVKVDTYDGKFDSIDIATRSDCNQKSNSNGDKTAAAVVGAAAILGIAALASKSHDRGDRYSDQQNTADYERGYRDGLYNQSYHNYSRSNAYSDGYSAGVEQRGHETSYRRGNQYGGGYTANAYVGDLVGQARDYASNQLFSRGFTMRDDKKTDDGRYRTYWNANTRQCLVMVSRNGYVNSLDQVSRGTCRD
jgi:hypothetical protein